MVRLTHALVANFRNQPEPPQGREHDSTRGRIAHMEKSAAGIDGGMMNGDPIPPDGGTEPDKGDDAFMFRCARETHQTIKDDRTHRIKVFCRVGDCFWDLKGEIVGR